MTRHMATVLVCALIGCAGGKAGTNTTTRPISPPPAADPGLKTVQSKHTFADTVSRLEQAIQAKGLTVFTKIDHAGNASKADLTLPPTTVLIFGKPQVGTQLMNTSRTVAIDLPQKMLVWQGGGTVKITYTEPAWLQKRHGLDSKAALIQKVSGLLGALAKGAAE